MLDQLLTHKDLPPESVFLNFRKLLDNMLTPYMVMDRELHIVYANPAYLKTVERSLDDIVGKYIFDSFPDTEDRVETVRKGFLKTLDGETTRLEKQHFHLEHADGSSSTRCWQCVQTPYFGASGEVLYIVQHAEDITEAEELRRKNEAIAHELSHRVKNIFAVIQAVANIAGQNETDIASFRHNFEGRLMAMSRTHSALSEADWKGISLEQVFIAELEQYGGVESGRISVSGPHITLGPKAAQDASMLIHELATNAAKYGCFHSETGRLDVHWQFSQNGNSLTIVWEESGLSGIREPEHTGFGTQLSSFMPNLKVSRTYRDEGLVVETTVPVEIATRGLSEVRTR